MGFLDDPKLRCSECDRYWTPAHRCRGLRRFASHSTVTDTPTDTSSGGIAGKHTLGRLRYDLIPPLGLREEALVYTIGAKKYDDWNWRKGMKWLTAYGALLRHLQQWRDGEKRCPHDGQHHLASVKFWANALMEYEHYGLGTDDRPEAK